MLTDRSAVTMGVEARVTRQPDGAVIHDPERLGETAVPQWFDPAWWREASRLRESARGRGEVHVVETPAGRAVLRHYRRGGLAARVSDDAYVYTGGERTRPFREFRVLADAHRRGLPVPAPLAARYVRRGPFYRADILVSAIERAETLAQRLARGAAVPWDSIGATLGRLHAAGLYHADLNAHNVMLDDAARVWIVDFDRAERREPRRRWQHANLRRLHRSLLKLGAPERVEAFASRAWPLLEAAHARIAQAA